MPRLLPFLANRTISNIEDNPSGIYRIQTFVTSYNSVYVAPYYVRMLKLARLAMIPFTSLRQPGRRRWCTAVVLVAVCTLTLSVATRYSFYGSTGNESITTIQTHQTWTPGLQRLLNNAASWMPPVVGSAIFHEPEFHPHVAPSGPTVSSVLLEKNHYNRPPPTLPLAL
jgi:hypothetical protein